jgi:nicotinamidase/pyrazinamidase
MLWADHALVGTEECELVPELQEFNFAIVQYKGMDPLCDSYSGVRDAMGRPTGLAKKLREHGMKRVFLAGLAFDYCVGSTAIDLAYENFETYVIEDLTRSVGVPDGNVDHMRNRMIAAGVKIVRVEDLVF